MTTQGASSFRLIFTHADAGNGALYVVPGSHRLPLLCPERGETGVCERGAAALDLDAYDGAAALQHEGGAGRFCRYQARRQAELFAELERRGLLYQEGIRSGVDGEAAVVAAEGLGDDQGGQEGGGEVLEGGDPSAAERPVEHTGELGRGQIAQPLCGRSQGLRREHFAGVEPLFWPSHFAHEPVERLHAGLFGSARHC